MRRAPSHRRTAGACPFGDESHGRRKSIRSECSLCSHLEQAMAFLCIEYDVRIPDTVWNRGLGAPPRTRAAREAFGQEEGARRSWLGTIAGRSTRAVTWCKMTGATTILKPTAHARGAIPAGGHHTRTVRT